VSAVSQRAFVGLGANLGDAAATLEAAFSAISGLHEVSLVARSSLYRSAPVQAVGPDFINAVAELHTTLGALALLHRLQDIEQRFGRVRSVRNAPRTLDLDLLLLGEQEHHDAELQLPHPRLHLRAFVLLPLAELDATLCIPGLGPIAPWLARAADQSIAKMAAPGSEPLALVASPAAF